MLNGLESSHFLNDVKKQKCNLENPCLMEFGARSPLGYIKMQLFYENKVCGLRTNFDLSTISDPFERDREGVCV